MRLLPLVVASGLLISAAVACGGGTPPPKDESEADDNGSAAPAASDDSTSAAPPADSTAAAPPPAPAAPPPEAAPPVDETWNVGHQIPATDISKTMKVANAKVQACFKTGLKKDKTINGDVKLKFVIANAGTVKVWKDDGSSMPDGDVTQCIGNVVQKLKFPKQKSPGDAIGSWSVHLGK